MMGQRKNENLHEENFLKLLREVAKQAKRLQVERRAVPPHHKIEKRHPYASCLRRKTQHEARKRTVIRENMTERRWSQLMLEKCRGTKSKSGRIERPLCVYPSCREKRNSHHIKDCTIAGGEAKKTFLEEFRMAKRARTDNSKYQSSRTGCFAHPRSSTTLSTV